MAVLRQRLVQKANAPNDMQEISSNKQHKPSGISLFYRESRQTQIHMWRSAAGLPTPRTRCTRHVARLRPEQSLNAVMDGIPGTPRSLGRPRTWWRDDMAIDHKEVGVEEDWREKAQDGTLEGRYGQRSQGDLRRVLI
uniref:Uncharacterized protein n=1 Tax=Timema genevievae TaxID=629358 RepID=A0A7R9JWI2_TIMGE|nr:unnamed protein product [Timema genevievae]